jgi:ABC-type sugar transport system permease subunit
MYYVIDAYTVFNDYGFAAAMSVMLVIMIFFITRVQNMLIMRREEV